MSTITRLDMPIPSGENRKAARMEAGLSQVQAAELMGYSLKAGSRGSVQSRTWQALGSTTDDRNMQGAIFAMFLLLMGQHPLPAWRLSRPDRPCRVPGSDRANHHRAGNAKAAGYLRSLRVARERVKQVIEGPDSNIDRINRSVPENGGQLSGKLLKEFPHLSQEPVGQQVVAAIKAVFAVRS